MGALSYWFAREPAPLSGIAEGVWGTLGLTALLAAFLVYRSLLPQVTPAVNRRFWRRISRLLVTTGVLLLVFLFFRVEGIPFFGSRFWIPALVIMDVAWLAAIIRYAMVQLPKERRAWEEERERRRYVR